MAEKSSSNCPLGDCNFSVSMSPQDSDDEANEEDDTLEKPAMKKEFSHRSPSPPAEDSEPEMTEEEKEFQLVCAVKMILLLLFHTANRVGLSSNTHPFHPFWMMFFR